MKEQEMYVKPEIETIELYIEQAILDGSEQGNEDGPGIGGTTGEFE